MTGFKIILFILLLNSIFCWANVTVGPWTPRKPDTENKVLVRSRRDEPKPTKPPAPKKDPPEPEYGIIVNVTEGLINLTSINLNRLKTLRVYPRIKATRYPDGRTCDKGQKPWTKKEVSIILKRANDAESFQENANGAKLVTLKLKAGQQKTLNEGASNKYGQNCANKEGYCVYKAELNSFVCRSSILQSQTMLILLLLASVLYLVNLEN